MSKIDLIHETGAFILVNKPAGEDCMSSDGQPGFFARLQQSYGSPLYPVHRLDKVTSGLILLARSSSAAADLAALFEQRQITKYYLGITDRKPQKKQGLIIGDMTKGRRGQWKLLRSRNHPAVTRFYSYGLNGVRLLVMKPATGKTHQLRVAMKSVAAPLFGDRLYGGSDAERTYLHAWALSFELYGQHYQFLLTPQQGEFGKSEVQQQLQALSPPWKHLPAQQ